MNKTIGIMAHVDAGKTTFSEQLLFHTKRIRKAGRVDHRDSFLDSHEIEKSRGITIFADQAVIPYNNSIYHLIDTPGHVDFSPEMERAIQVMDYALVIISSVDGIEGHTETIWELLKKHQVPTFFFINKTDREGADVDGVMDSIQMNFTEDAFDLTQAFKNGIMNDELIEFIAEREESLLERYLEGNYDSAIWLDTCRQLIRDRRIFPCSSGSALKGSGVIEFFGLLDLLTESSYSANAPFSAKVYKIRHDENGMKITFLKALSGSLNVRDEIFYGEKGNPIHEKITQIRKYDGNTFITAGEASAGELFAVTGISNAAIGEQIGELAEPATYEMIPTLKSKILHDSTVPVKDILKIFRMLDAEDPSLKVVWDAHFQEIHIHVMGVIQLEVLEHIVRDRFGFTVSFGVPQILYMETIEAPITGYGHFEPLKHYAEVHLKIEPSERGSGVTLENLCHADDLSTGNQNLVLQHLNEREHHGLLTGSELTDVKITLLTGRGHNQHTSGGDFREAAYRALRQGLEKAKNRLLEPIYRFKIKVDLDVMGKVLSDIQQAAGRFETPDTTGNSAVIHGTVPVATFMDYSVQFASLTQGKGSLSLQFGGYDYCHNADEVIEKIAYNKDADPEYTSTSIFCSKGQGYKVPWYEAEEAMHCL